MERLSWSSMRRILAVCFIALISVSVVFACGFQSSRVTWQHFYRAQGWQLPGVAGATLAPAQTTVPGLTAKSVHLGSNIIEFPSTDFVLDGKPRTMPRQPMKASLTRWEFQGSGRVVAYTYNLAPVTVERQGENSVTTSIAQCTFQATFIDDRGDGVFRVMLTQPMTAELIPAWARPPKS